MHGVLSVSNTDARNIVKLLQQPSPQQQQLQQQLQQQQDQQQQQQQDQEAPQHRVLAEVSTCTC